MLTPRAAPDAFETRSGVLKETSGRNLHVRRASAPPIKGYTEACPLEAIHENAPPRHRRARRTSSLRPRPDHPHLTNPGNVRARDRKSTRLNSSHLALS